MTDLTFEEELTELESAEEFLEYFGITYDPSVVRVNRLHILQRFHNYLAGLKEMPTDEAEKRELYHDMLAGAYHDFVVSDAQTEKVFRVFHMHEPRQVSIPVTDLMAGLTDRSKVNGRAPGL